MNHENKKEKWEIKIDEWLKADYQVSPDFRESLKTIIRCLLRAQKEEIIKEIEKYWQNNYGLDEWGKEIIYKEQFQDLINKIKEI